MTLDMQALKTHIEEFRGQTVAALKQLTELMAQVEVTQVPAEVGERWLALEKNDYRVLVLGEAKRGKSRFINALLGHNLLPVDVDISTSQVFCIRASQQEAYRLRYESEKAVVISADELLEYGSQAANQPGRVLRHPLRGLYWIEADVPARFLPEGVALLDTPGLGSLYPTHKGITGKFLPLADAVIFMLNSRDLIDQSELYWIEDILQVTPLIFFVQTMVDPYEEEVWREIQKRHEERLRQRFGSSLGDVHVWPFSSKALLEAVEYETSDVEEPRRQRRIEALVEESRQSELINALQVFLFRAAGMDRCTEALLAGLSYHMQLREELRARLATLETMSVQELLKQKAQADQRRKRLEKEWGKNGKERKRLLGNIKAEREGIRRRLAELLMAGSALEDTFHRKINEVKSIGAVNDLGKSLYDEVSQELDARLSDIKKEAQNRCARLLRPLAAISLSLDLPSPAGYPLEVAKIKVDLVARLKQLQESFEQGGIVGKAVIVAVLSHVFLPVTFPVTMIGVSLVSGWSSVQGWTDATEKQLQDARRMLHDHLDQILQKKRDNFSLGQDIFDGRSLIDYHLDAFERNLQEQIEEKLNEKLTYARKEYARLNAQVTSSEQERTKEIHKLHQQLEAWQELDTQMQESSNQLYEIQSTFDALGMPRARVSLEEVFTD